MGHRHEKHQEKTEAKKETSDRGDQQAVKEAYEGVKVGEDPVARKIKDAGEKAADGARKKIDSAEEKINSAEGYSKTEKDAMTAVAEAVKTGDFSKAAEAMKKATAGMGEKDAHHEAEKIAKGVSDAFKAAGVHAEVHAEGGNYEGKPPGVVEVTTPGAQDKVMVPLDGGKPQGGKGDGAFYESGEAGKQQADQASEMGAKIRDYPKTQAEEKQRKIEEKKQELGVY